VIALREDEKIADIMKRAHAAHIVVPAFNAAYIPMLRPIVDALRECETFGLIEVARHELQKFGAQSFEAIADEYRRFGDKRFTRLHLDHIPVVDEDGLRVDWRSLIQAGLRLGYDSVMVDGSRVPFDENMKATATVVQMAHERAVPVEGELGAVLGHESNLSIPYAEIFEQGIGFTDVEQAATFVSQTQVDWLSVAIGNIHGAIAGAAKDKDKVEARLNIDHLRKLSEKTRIPLVLHGGSAIRKEYILEAIRQGITKINIGTEIRLAYERARKLGVEQAQKAVAAKVKEYVRDTYHVEGTAKRL